MARSSATAVPGRWRVHRPATGPGLWVIQDDCGPGLVGVLHVPGQPGLFPLVGPAVGSSMIGRSGPVTQGASDHHTALLTSGRSSRRSLARLRPTLRGAGMDERCSRDGGGPPLRRVGQGAADRFLDAHGDRVSRYKVLPGHGRPLPLLETPRSGVEQPRSSFIGLDEAQQAADRCRLAGAVRPMSHELTGRDVDETSRRTG